MREDRQRLIRLARDPKVLYVLSALSGVEDANEEFVAKVTGLSTNEVREAIELLAAERFVVAGGKKGVAYASLSNLGRSIFKIYWKKLRQCER